jgi:hypothetical protein
VFLVYSLQDAQVLGLVIVVKRIQDAIHALRVPIPVKNITNPVIRNIALLIAEMHAIAAGTVINFDKSQKNA